MNVHLRHLSDTSPSGGQEKTSEAKGLSMKVVRWWKNRIKTDFSTKGFLARVALDLFLSNFGFLLGILVTVFFWGFTWDKTPQTFFNNMVIHVWLANVPLLTFCCLFSYISNGLYRGTQNITYLSIIPNVGSGVSMAFLIFLSLIYMTRTFMPRSTMMATLFFIFILILSERLLWASFSRYYYIAPSNSYDPRIEKIVRELTVLSQQDGLGSTRRHLFKIRLAVF